MAGVGGGWMDGREGGGAYCGGVVWGKGAEMDVGLWVKGALKWVFAPPVERSLTGLHKERGKGKNGKFPHMYVLYLGYVSTDGEGRL